MKLDAGVKVNNNEVKREQRCETNQKPNMDINAFNKITSISIRKTNKCSSGCTGICFVNRNIGFFIKYIYIHICFLVCCVALFLLYFCAKKCLKQNE